MFAFKTVVMLTALFGTSAFGFPAGTESKLDTSDYDGAKAAFEISKERALGRYYSSIYLVESRVDDFTTRIQELDFQADRDASGLLKKGIKAELAESLPALKKSLEAIYQEGIRELYSLGKLDDQYKYSGRKDYGIPFLAVPLGIETKVNTFLISTSQFVRFPYGPTLYTYEGWRKRWHPRYSEGQLKRAWLASQVRDGRTLFGRCRTYTCVARLMMDATEWISMVDSDLNVSKSFPKFKGHNVSFKIKLSKNNSVTSLSKFKAGIPFAMKILTQDLPAGRPKSRSY